LAAGPPASLSMEHADHVNLLRAGIAEPGGRWADLGSGAGAFTLALAELIGPTGEIYSVDKDGGALREQERRFQARFPGQRVHYLQADFTHPLSLPPLEGIVMANALHYHRNKAGLVQQLRHSLKPGGRLLLVEYNVEAGNFAVPYPISYPRWETLARECGFAHTQLLLTRPSRFLKEFYAAASW
jgi:ubiquinone/menaquinone biosynthesis C-methylase UbiE